jgi:hypothetical protein
LESCGEVELLLFVRTHLSRIYPPSYTNNKCDFKLAKTGQGSEPFGKTFFKK